METSEEDFWLARELGSTRVGPLNVMGWGAIAPAGRSADSASGI